MIRTVFRPIARAPGFLALAGCLSLSVACSTPQPKPAAPVAAPESASAEFTIAASMNDTWNTVGQILVRTEGVTYESRAQMLGIYALHYRGERFLIRTQAVVMEKPTDGLRTRVRALGLDGKPKHSAAANALIGILKQRVPQEIDKYTLPIEFKKKPKKQPPKVKR